MSILGHRGDSDEPKRQGETPGDGSNAVDETDDGVESAPGDIGEGPVREERRPPGLNAPPSR